MGVSASRGIAQAAAFASTEFRCLTSGCCRHIWTSSIHDLVFSGNYHDTALIENNGVNITMEGNVLVNGSVFPPKAAALMKAAGPQGSPWPSLKGGR